MKHGLIDFSEGQNDSSAGRGGGVVYVPFRLHALQGMISALKTLSKYFAVSLLRKSDLMEEHALWSATKSINPDIARESFGVSIDQEDIYCTLSTDELSSIVNNADLINVLGRIENCDHVRMIKLSVLKKFDTNDGGRRGNIVGVDKDGFIGSQEATSSASLMPRAVGSSRRGENFMLPVDAIGYEEERVSVQGEPIHINDILLLIASFLLPPSFRHLSNVSKHTRRVLLKDDDLVKQMRYRNVYFSLLDLEASGGLVASAICCEEQLLMKNSYSVVPRASAFTSSGCQEVIGGYCALSVPEAACMSALKIKDTMVDEKIGGFDQGFNPTGILSSAIDDNGSTIGAVSFAITNPFGVDSNARAACFGVHNFEFCRVACVGYDDKYGGFIAVGFGVYEKEKLPNLTLCGRYLREGDCRLGMSARTIFDSSDFYQWSMPWETSMLNFDAAASTENETKAIQCTPDPPTPFKLRLQLKCHFTEGDIESLIYHYIPIDKEKKNPLCAECRRCLRGASAYDMSYRNDKITGLELCISRLCQDTNAAFCSEKCFHRHIAPFASFEIICNRKWELQCAGCGDRVHPKNAPKEKDRMIVFYQVKSKRETSSGVLIGGNPSSRLLLCSPTCACAALPEVERFCREDWQNNHLTLGGRYLVLKVTPSIVDDPATVALMKKKGWSKDKDQHFVSNDPRNINGKKPKFDKWGM